MRPPSSRSRPGRAQTDMSRLQKLLWAAERPIVLLGGSRWSEAACAAVDALCRALCAAGRDHVPPRASVRPAASLLRRRPRHRAQSEAARAREGRRPHRPGRRPARRDAVAGLHAARHSGPRQTLGARPSRRRGARPRLPAASRDQCRADRLCGRARRPAAAERDHAGATRRRPRMPTSSPGPTSRPRVPGAVNLGEIIVWLARQASRRRRDLQRRRQFLGLGAPLLPLSPLRHPARADLGLDGLWRAGGGRR